MEGRDTLRYHRTLAQQTTVSTYRQETFEGIAVHLAGISGGSSVASGGAMPPRVVLVLAAQLEAASTTHLTLILDNGPPYGLALVFHLEKSTVEISHRGHGLLSSMAACSDAFNAL